MCAVGVCLLLALSSALGKGTDAPVGRSVPVLVAARDLPAGHTVRAQDVRVAQWPPSLRPSSARAAPTGVVGRRLVAPVAAREAVTSDRLLGPGLAAALPAGLVVAPVTVDDPHVAEFVHAGDRVDLLATSRPPDGLDPPAPHASGVATLARAVLVLAAFSGAAVSGSDGAGSEIVLAVDRSVAIAVARDRSTHLFTVVTDPP